MNNYLNFKNSTKLKKLKNIFYHKLLLKFKNSNQKEIPRRDI